MQAEDGIVEECVDENLLKFTPITNSFKFFMDKCEREIIENHFIGDDNYRDFDQRVKERWCELCIDGVIQILNKICACKMRANGTTTNDSKYSKTFMIIGQYDVFKHRTEMAGPMPDYTLEIKQTEQAVCQQQNTVTKSLKAICHIWANTKNYEIISVDFYDLCDDMADNPFEYFFGHLGQIFRPLISAYLEAIKWKQCQPFAKLIIWKDIKQITTANIISEEEIKSAEIVPETIHAANVNEMETGKCNRSGFVFQKKNTNAITILALENDKKIVQELLFKLKPKRYFEIESQEVKESWAIRCISHARNILKDMGGFKFCSDIVEYDQFCKTYDAIITHNVFHQREYNTRNIRVNSFSKMTRKILKGYITDDDWQLKKPLNAKIHIWTDDFTSVIIGFESLNENDEETICYFTVSLRKCMQDFISTYFNESIRKCDKDCNKIFRI